MEIRNEIKQNEEKKKFVQRNLADVQRARLNKLMDNPEKIVIIPESKRKDKEYSAPSFVRNVMGSSAGAGSGEFHVYRHLRRKEYARQKHMKLQTESERLDDEYQQRLEDNQKLAEERTEKKRQKRLKKKKNQKNKGKKPKLSDEKDESESEELSENNADDDDEEENDDETKECEDEDTAPNDTIITCETKEVQDVNENLSQDEKSNDVREDT